MKTSSKKQRANLFAFDFPMGHEHACWQESGDTGEIHKKPGLF